jgi:UDP-glucose 4-epimerase
MAKILVTGGAGYIGSHTIVELLRLNYEIVSIDNYSNSYPASIDNIKKISGKDFNHYQLDLLDTSGLDTLLRQHDDIAGVIHFAASIEVEDSVKHPLHYYRNNLTALLNVMEQIRDRNISHFVFSSSCTVYGEQAKMPVNEESPIGKPASPYGATKQMGEQMIADLIRAGSMERAVILRYFNPAGAHDSGLIGECPRHPVSHLVPVIAQVASGDRPFLSIFGDDYPTRDGSCIRDYIHVSDLARAHVQALEYSMQSMQAGCEYFNLGSGEGVSVKEAVRAFEKATGIEIPVRISARRPGDMAAIYADTSRAEKVLKWERHYDLNDIMGSAWQFEQQKKDFLS